MRKSVSTPSYSITVFGTDDSRFPNYPNKGVVELGAKVLTKEIVWG